MITNLQLGADVSEQWFDVCALVGKKPPVMRFNNDEAGFIACLAWANAFGARSIHIAMEHTGGCETALALFCHATNLKVSLLDGFQVSRFRESEGRAKAKTDQQDAKLIAKFLRERRPALWSPHPEEYRVLTELVRHRQDLVDSKKAWTCRARKASISPLVAAQRACMLAVCKEQIKEADKAILKHVKSHPQIHADLKRLCTLPGIATVSAVRILAEMGPVDNYKTPRELALFAGLCPIANQSGKAKGKGVLFPYGNRQLRNALYMPVIVAMRVKSALFQFTERIRGNGGDKSNKTVITAAMRKLIQTIHGMLSSGTDFDQARFLKDMKKPGQAQ
jgi:transposase